MSLFGGFDDPFFGGTHNLMRQMDHMMSSMIPNFEEDPFFGGNPLAAITGAPTASNALIPRQQQQQQQQQQRLRRASDPFSALGIPNIANMMSNMDQMTQQGSCHSFSSSSVMTMMTGPDGRPQVYQATSSSRAVPGGVRETRHSVNDSRTGLRKMAIGHHIGDRAHIIEREQTGSETEERQEFVNLEEEEAASFNREFEQRSQHGGRVNSPASLQYRTPRRQPRDRDGAAYPRSARSLPAIGGGPTSSEERARRRDREHRSNRSHPHR